MTVLILEGPDGAGKTTLANELLKTAPYGSTLFHHGAYHGERDIARHYLRSLYSGLLHPKRLTLLDRSWIAEPIYGFAARGGVDRIEPWQRRMLNRVALGAGAVVVLCLPPESICADAWGKRLGQEYLKREKQLSQVYRGYEVWFRSPERYDGPPVIRYDWTSANEESLDARLDRYLRGARNEGPGIGSWNHARTLLIGDRVNRKPGGRDRLPFCSLKKLGCSAWLTSKLEEWRVPERSLYWVNQHKLDVEAFGDEGPLGRFDQVIALGAHAEKWCARNTVPCTPVEHPMYWKRFHAKAEYPLREVLA